jgi:hypothetical protein
VEHQRKQAKALVRAFRAADPAALRRAEDVLGSRARERFLLSDAQHVVAREQGFASWRELKRTHETRPRAAWVEGVDVRVPTELRYGPDDPVSVVVRRRGWRFDVSDAGRAVELAGARPGWRAVAKPIVEDTYRLNVNRRGVVFVQSNEGRLDNLIARVAECSVALYEELLDQELGSP